jgi:hypothetical protein
MNRGSFQSRALLPLALMVFIAALATGCGSVSTHLTMEPGERLASTDRFWIAEVLDQSSQPTDVDATGLLRTALHGALSKQSLSASGQTDAVALNAAVVEYAKGNAFKRWLWPGFGKTVLATVVELNRAGRPIGRVNAQRTVTAGGAYTVGAWKSVFEDVSRDIARELKSAR